MARASQTAVIPVESVLPQIRFLRGKKVLIDSDLALLYAVPTKSLNRAVKRNLMRFPPDFMFQLTLTEARALRFQNGISKDGNHGGRRYLPYVFTQEGVAMLSSVLRNVRAVQVNIAIMRAFVRLREILASNHDLAVKLEEMEQHYDTQFKIVFDAIRELMEGSPPPPKRQIGFHP